MSKVKVEEAEIVVHGTADKPYFEIKYREVGKKDYNIGYSSYDVRKVFGWLESEFDIVGKSNDIKKRVLKSLLCARLEMRNKNILTLNAMTAIVDGLVYLVGDGESANDCEMEKPKTKPRETLLVLTSENLPKCFGEYYDEENLECMMCSADKECKEAYGAENKNRPRRY